MKKLQDSYVSNRHHFNEMTFDSGLGTLSFFGLKVKMLIKEFEIICNILKNLILYYKCFSSFLTGRGSGFVFKHGRVCILLER